MRGMLRTGVAAFAFLTATAAMAAPPTALAERWSGFYAGGHLGGAWSRSDLSGYDGLVFPPFINAGLPPILVLGQSSSLPGSSGRSSSLIGGAHAGYNWQSANFVYGVEADIAGTRLRGGATSTASRFGLQSVSLGATSEVDWIATFRGRLGVGVDRWLLYVTGGLAVSRIDTSGTGASTFSAPIIVPVPGTYTSTSSSSRGRAGWTVGAGAEWALDETWSIGAEYRHIDLGKVSISTAIPDGLGTTYATANQDVSVKVDQVTARVTYRFRPR